MRGDATSRKAASGQSLRPFLIFVSLRRASRSATRGSRLTLEKYLEGSAFPPPRRRPRGDRRRGCATPNPVRGALRGDGNLLKAKVARQGQFVAHTSSGPSEFRACPGAPVPEAERNPNDFASRDL